MLNVWDQSCTEGYDDTFRALYRASYTLFTISKNQHQQKRRCQTFGFTYLEMKDTNLWRLMQWWAREELNFRPHAYQACALTT
jgi:hypothetical protein